MFISKAFCHYYKVRNNLKASQLNSGATCRFLSEMFWTGRGLKIKGLDLFGLKTMNISNSTSLLTCQFSVHLKDGNVSGNNQLKVILDLDRIHLLRDKRLPSCHGDRCNDILDQSDVKKQNKTKRTSLFDICSKLRR